MIAVALSGAFLITTVLSHSILHVKADRETFSEITQIISDHDSDSSAFKILEIVPDKEGVIKTDNLKGGKVPLGNIGFLVDGQEPYTRSFSGQDMNSEQLKNEYLLKLSTQRKDHLWKDENTEKYPLKRETRTLIDGMAEIPPSASVKSDKVSGVHRYSDVVMKTSSTNTGSYDLDKLEFFRTIKGDKDVSGAFSISAAEARTNDTPGLVAYTAENADSAKTYGRYHVAFQLNENSPYGVKTETAITLGDAIAEDYTYLGYPVYTKTKDNTYVFRGYLSRSADGKAELTAAENAPETTGTTNASAPSGAGEDQSARALIVRRFYASQGENGEEEEPKERKEGEEQASGEEDKAKEKSEEAGSTEAAEEPTEGSTSEPAAGEKSESSETPGTPDESKGTTEEIKGTTEEITGTTEETTESGDSTVSPTGDGASPETVYAVSFELKDKGGYTIYKFELAEKGEYTANVSSPWVTDTGYGFIKTDTSKQPYIRNSENKGAYYPEFSSGATGVNVYDAKTYELPVFKNNNMFRRYVFDMEKDWDKIHIKVNTETANDVSVSDIENADLIYISADGAANLGDLVDKPKYGSTYNGDDKKRDIPYDAAKKILEYATNKKKPVVIEAALMNESDYKDTRIRKLAKALRSRSLSDAYTEFSKSDSTTLLDLPEYTDSDNQYVYQKLFFLNHNGEFLASESFYESTQSAFQAQNGFSTVSKRIQEERKKHSSDRFPDYINTATSIRHILIFADTSSKGVYRVLEIEPQDQSAKRIKWDGSKWGDGEELHYDLSAAKSSEDSSGSSDIWNLYYTDHSNDTAKSYSTDARLIFQTEVDKGVDGIKVTSMSVHEFIGRIEDLNSTYDLIYIGADTIGMKTDKGKTNYKDNSLDGLIYSDVGDKHTMLITNDRGYTGGESRFSGADITKMDIKRLKEYAQAGLPVIIADELLDDSKKNVNTARVKSSSNLYTLLNALLGDSGTYPAVYARGNVESGSSDFYVKMETARPIVTLSGTYTNDIVPTVRQSNGQFIMSVNFRINDIWSNDADYAAEFYIDRNSDGKYAANEQDNSAVSFLHGSETIGASPTSLKAGTDYTLTRTFAPEQKGVVPWKLVIYQSSGGEKEKLRRSSVVAYANNEILSEEKPTIKVLQLKTDNSQRESLDMEKEQTKAKNNASDKRLIGEYMNSPELPYILSVRSITCEDFYKLANDIPKAEKPEALKSIMEDYDLVIMGFADSYEIKNDEVAEALMLYIDEGRSTLFSHDCTSYRYNKSRNDSRFNLYVRDIVGMDRYGYNRTRTDTKFEGWQDSFYDPAPNGETDNIEGLVYHCIRRGEISDLIFNTPYQYNRLTACSGNAGSVSAAKTLYATKVNDGQITKYPFVLDDEIEIVSTHAQYFQLNLNIDQDDDEMSDLVVWYCLGDTITPQKNSVGEFETKNYAYSKNDVRNNYLIYSMGNVTYTGQGHMYTDSGNQYLTRAGDAECKLFMNTIAVAFSANVQDPNVTIHYGPEVSSGEKYAETLPYDAAFMEELVDAKDNPEKYSDDVKEDSLGTDGTATTLDNAGDAAHLGAYPDHGEDTYTVYFRPEELNINVDTGTQRTEVAFFLESESGKELIKAPDGEKAVEGVELKENGTSLKLIPLSPGDGIKVYKLSGGVGSTGVELSGSVSESPGKVKVGSSAEEKQYPSYSLKDSSEGITSYALDDTSGNVMYKVEFPASLILNLKNDTGQLMNDPKFHIVAHTTLKKYKTPYNRYADAHVTYSRAVLFNLE